MKVISNLFPAKDLLYARNVFFTLEFVFPFSCTFAFLISGSHKSSNSEIIGLVEEYGENISCHFGSCVHNHMWVLLILQ